MASRKEYGLDFVLNAALNGNFKGTFSSAQAEFAKLGSEIRDLGRMQSDISSYQKQQEAVTNTGAKLQNLQRQYDLLQQEIGETEGPTTALEREQAKLEQRIRDTETALERQNQRLSATGSRLEEAGVDTADLAGESARLSEKLGELKAQQEAAAGAVRSAGQAYQEAGEDAANFGTRASEAFSAAQQALVSAGIAGALREIKEAYAECVSVAAEFQEGMSTVEALSGATAAEMAELTAKAKEMGAETKYTAKESADAFGYMALAGWNAQRQIAGIEPILNLAAAANMDLAQASDIVTDYLTAFGLTANDTAAFTDKMAYAMSHSNTNVIQLGEAYKNVASTAKSMGYTVEETTAVIMGMANAGVKGGEAGTALNAIMTRLATDTKGCASALEEYGVYVYDAQGNMNTLSSILNGLVGVWGALTDAEQAALAKTIAGTNQYSSLQTIMTACSEEAARSGQSFNDYAAALENCSGTAKNMAATMMNNLNGQLTLMDSAADALRTTIGEQFNPELRRMAEAGTDALTWANDFVQAHPALVKGVMTFTGVMGTAAVAVTGVNATLAAFKALNVAALFTGPVGAILGGAAAVAAVTAAVVGFVTAADDGVPPVRELTEAAQDMQEAMDEASASYQETATQTMATAEVASIYIDKLAEIEDATSGNVAENQEYHNILALLTRTVPELADYIDLENNAIEGGTEALRQHTEAWKKDAEAQAYQEYINSLYDQYGEVMAESAENSIKLTQAQIKLETAEKNRDAALERMNELSQKAYENGEFLSQEYYQLENALYGYNDEIYTAQREIGNLNKAIDKDVEAVAAAEAEIESAEEAVRSLTGATEEQTEAEAGASAQTRELQGVLGEVTGELTALAASYLEAYTAAEESISGQYALWDKAAEVTATSAGTITAALDSQLAYWERYNENLDALSDRSTDIAGLSDMIATFADGSKESVNAIAGMAGASDEELRTMVSKWQELQEQQSETAGSLAELAAGFPEQIDTLVSSMEDGVAGMSLPDEAEESARSTIQAFIDKAEDMIPVVRDAYALLGQTAADALGIDMAPVSAHVNGAGNVEAFASGTDNAPPGWAWVGEEGPELIRMRGGETVLPATVSRDFAALSACSAESTPAAEAAVSPESGGSSAPVAVELHFHIDGGAPAETVEALHSYVESAGFEERVMDVVARAAADARRGYWD